MGVLVLVHESTTSSTMKRDMASRAEHIHRPTTCQQECERCGVQGLVDTVHDVELHGSGSTSDGEFSTTKSCKARAVFAWL